MQVRKSVFGLMVLGIGFLFQGCTTLEGLTGLTEAEYEQEKILRSAIDDQALRDKLAVEAKKRVDAKTLTTGDILRSQLGRRTTQVAFAKPRMRALPPEQQYEYGRASVVIIGSFFMCGKCSNLHSSTAAGFAVAEEGVFLTNYHVVSGLTNTLGMVAISAEGQMGGVTEILACNPVEDWALIRIPELKLRPLPLKANVPVGTEVFLVSHPNQHFFSYGKGHVARYGKSRTFATERSSKVRKLLGVTEWLEITAEFGKGASGGPVLDGYGNVVGLISRVESRKTPENSHDSNIGTMVFKQCTPISMVIEGASAAP